MFRKTKKSKGKKQGNNFKCQYFCFEFSWRYFLTPVKIMTVFLGMFSQFLSCFTGCSVISFSVITFLFIPGRQVAASSNVDQYDYEMVSFNKSGKETNQTRSNPAAVQPNANYNQTTSPGKLDYDNVEYDEFGQMITPNGLSLRRHFKSETELDDTILNMYDDQTLTTETEG